MTFAAIDLVFFGIILVFMITAAVRGLIREFFSKAAFICGIIGAILLTPKLQPYVNGLVKNTVAAKIGSFILIFIIIFLIVKIIQELFSSVFSGEILRGLDHSLGLGFGIIEGLVVVTFILTLVEIQPWFDAVQILKGSFFAKILNGLIQDPVQKIQGMAV
ncbi:MAG TPA: colicin V production protein [Treponema sp.]|nr:colicin V production protein [Treponema sp.]